ncbi:TolC family protein [Alysiella crassa]|uniref:Outer membrane channel protein n=4 Tax=Alysiella crassa TaxID=153491 RepID=A0A376BTK5_9NEIS|nr:TolC family protein [Alysiella crassa]SSY80259.1 outer membrane channel protein [Alysiella crassa]
MLKPVTRIAAACALIFSQSAQAATLQEVLRQSFSNDPELLEARANKDAAQTDIKIAKSGHLPTFSLTAAQVLAQKHRYESSNRSSFNPGLQGRLNLYSFGGVDARVRYSEHKHDYFHHKYYETQETVGQTISQLYLSALRAKENIVAAQSNLQRHDQIIKDLQIIAHYDKGRQSELDQAMARRLRVHAYLADQTRSMELSLSRLGKYTQSRLNPATLTDPFAGENASSIVKRYQATDLGQQPSFQAQQAERESVLAELDVNKSARYPSIDLIASASRDNKEIYVNFNWDFFSPTANYQVEKSAQTLVAAEAKSDQILRDVAERSRSSEVDMRQSLNRFNIAQQQIAAQKKVIKAYELQFKIARRTLIDVLDAYSDLWNIESEVVASQNDFRDAALEYLASQSALARFAGLVEDRSSPERKVRRSFREHLPDEFLPKNLQERFDKIDFDAIDAEVAHLGDQLNYLKDKTKEKLQKLDKMMPEYQGETRSANETTPTVNPEVNTGTAADYPVIVDSQTLVDSNQPYVPSSKAAAKSKVAAAKKSQKNKHKTQAATPKWAANGTSDMRAPLNIAMPVVQPNSDDTSARYEAELNAALPEPTVDTRPTMSAAQAMPDKVLTYDDVMDNRPSNPLAGSLNQEYVPMPPSVDTLSFDDVMATESPKTQVAPPNEMAVDPIKFVTFRDKSADTVAPPKEKAKKPSSAQPNQAKPVVKPAKPSVPSATEKVRETSKQVNDKIQSVTDNPFAGSLNNSAEKVGETSNQVNDKIQSVTENPFAGSLKDSAEKVRETSNQVNDKIQSVTENPFAGSLKDSAEKVRETSNQVNDKIQSVMDNPFAGSLNNSAEKVRETSNQVNDKIQSVTDNPFAGSLNNSAEKVRETSNQVNDKIQSITAPTRTLNFDEIMNSAETAGNAAAETLNAPTPPKVKLVESLEHGVIMDNTPRNKSWRSLFQQHMQPDESADEKAKKELLKDASSRNELPNALTFAARVPYEFQAA